jgi:hypothetical protein
MKYNPRQLHLQYNLPDTLLKISIIIKYDKKLNEWQFSAFKCRHCNTALKFQNTIAKHYNTCKQLNSSYKKKKEKTDANTNIDD